MAERKLTSSKTKNASAKQGGARPDSKAGARIKRLKKKAAGTKGKTLRPEDIGVARVQFSGSDSLVFGHPNQPDILNDGDPTNDIYIFDWPPGDADKVIQLPWPPGSEPD